MPKAPSVLVITDLTTEPVGATPTARQPVASVEVLPASDTPTPDTMRQYDFVVLLGPFNREIIARQLAGAAKLAARDGTIVILAIGGDGAAPGDAAAADTLVEVDLVAGVGPSNLVSLDENFVEYVAVYGSTSVAVGEALPTGSTVLAEVEVGREGQRMEAALWLPIGVGGVYFFPYRSQGNLAQVVSTLLKGVLAHQGGTVDKFPDYLRELELPGEAQLREQIAALRDEIASATAQTDVLDRWKLLVGELSGDPFESLVIEALNLVLDGTEYAAEDRPDLNAEDFWLVRDGVDFALCEAKGINAHVRRQDVGQLEGHRENAGRHVGETPGLLVMNVLRTRDLESKQSAVSADVARHGARLNVVILRAWDLYGLVGLHLAGETSGRDRLLEALNASGGWLEVDGDRVELHTG